MLFFFGGFYCKYFLLGFFSDVVLTILDDRSVGYWFSVKIFWFFLRDTSKDCHSLVASKILCTVPWITFLLCCIDAQLLKIRIMLVSVRTHNPKNQCVEAAVFGFADSLFVLISLDALVIFLCIFYGLRAALCVRVENLRIEENAIKAADFLPDVQLRVIISSGGITQENFSIGRLKFSLHLDIVANVIHQVCKHVFDFVVL